MIRRCLPLLALLLGACASAPTPPAERAGKSAGPPPSALVAAVRAAGQSGVELEVQPLRDPQVEDLRHRAEALEAAGRYREADAALVQALALVPDDPELLQWRAELALLRRAWDEAVGHANASYLRGPRLGGLCRRNWTTIELVRERQQHAEAAEAARRQRESCTVAPPVRM